MGFKVQFQENPEWKRFNRRLGKGDLFDRFRQSIERGKPIPVNFYRINDPYFGYDCRPSLTPSKLEDSIQRLNEIYGRATGNKLAFFLSGIYEAERDDKIFNALEPTDDYLAVKIQEPSGIMSTFGNYEGHGILELHPNVFLMMDNCFLTFPHEAGHGIIGYGHCESEICLMHNSSDNSDGNFCDIDKDTLLRLADGL